MLLLPMFLASVHLSRVNLNGIGDALMAADGPKGTHDGLTGAFALQTSNFSPNCGSASRKWQREEGSVFGRGLRKWHQHHRHRNPAELASHVEQGAAAQPEPGFRSPPGLRPNAYPLARRLPE